MKKQNKRTKTSKRHWPLIVIAFSVLIIAVVGIYAYNRICRAEYDGEKVRLYIPSGATEASIADTLRTRLGQDFGQRVYDIWSWRKGLPATAVGSYLIEPGDLAVEVSRKILTGAETPVKVTFNNVRTLPQLAERVSRNMAFTADDFMAACDSVLPTLGYSAAQYPAAFVPDTYEFYWSAKPATVVKRLVDVRNRYWTPERQRIASALGLSATEVATLASIVEEETAKADERPTVARLYLNRLKKGMKLQADPTVKYAIGDFTLRRILSRHLNYDSPYNTYLHAGLPPGPIRIVERKTLDDVLYAPSHDYLYMCAKEDFSGYHNFAVSGQEHQANARRYHEALNARGIK